MSKKFLKGQAKELLGFELREIKGGISNLDVCDNGCLQFFI